MLRKALLLAVPLTVGWFLFSQRTDIMRYVKIRQMSMGNGHPENVPAGGSHRYREP